jgi:hypothetical protein
MLSRSYQQSSEHNGKAAKEDPANQLLWRMNRKRLDFESMRDTFLALGGSVDLAQGGRPVDLTTEPFTARRTVYGFVERQNLPGLFRTFDFASPDTTSPQRFATTVPQQALFLMNSPFVVQQAGKLIARPDVQHASTTGDKLAQLHRICFQRPPDKDELLLAKRFIETQATNQPAVESPAWQYGWGAFDKQAKRTKSFSALPHFNSYSWQGGKELPDAQLGWVLLNAEGGHPGNDQQHAAIRRWVAPRDGRVAIYGELHHPEDKGDGVRARVVSSASGLAGEWTAFKSKTSTPVEKLPVKRGDLIDFITDCRESVSHDSFTWSPKIKYMASEGASSASSTASSERVEWDAKADFAGPVKEKPRSLDVWQKYAQVLLLANETLFVD